MPRSDLFPPDIMDKHAAFAGAINQYLRLVQNWEIRRFDPNQPRVPVGQPGAGQWLDENDGDPVSDEASSDPTPSSDSPQAPPAAANDGASRFQVSLRPADIPKPDDPLLSEAGRDPSAGMLLRWHTTTPTYVAMYSVPTFVDPRIGFPRSTDRSFIGQADATRPEGPYAEAYRMETFKALFLPLLPKYEFHHIVEEHQYLYFTDRPNDPRSVNNSSNIVILPKDVHTCISAEYSTNVAPGITLRESLRGQPYLEQYQRGLQEIEKCQSKVNNETATERSTQGQSQSESTSIPPLVFPPLPPRIPGKNLNIYQEENLYVHSLGKEYKAMIGDGSKFDSAFLLQMLDELDEVSYEYNQKTVENANVIKEKAWAYIAQFEKTEEFWKQLTPFLSSPRKMVRVWIAVEMFRGGRKDGWATFISDVLPSESPTQLTKAQINKNFAAESYARLFINLSHRILDDLGVKPSLNEVEDQWIAEGRIKRPFVRFSNGRV
ncbi:MAG: hypothetical protein ACOVVK_03145 [Elsteraceae bacterium]